MAQEFLEILLALGFSWARMTIALLLSILFSLCVGILAGVNRVAEKIIIPILDVLQSIPILSFFPLALYIFIGIHPIIGPEAAAIFLIFTSQAWNIAFGVYEAVKLIPTNILESVRSLGLGALRRIRNLYIPAAFPRIAANIPPSWANGLYFLVACEIITIGEAEWRLFGIGTVSTGFMLAGKIPQFFISLAAVMIAVVLSNIFLFIPLMRLSERYKFEEYAAEAPRVWIERVTKSISGVIGKLLADRKIPSYASASQIISRFSSMVRKNKILASAFVVMAVAALSIYAISSINVLYYLEVVASGLGRFGLVDPLVMIGFSLSRVASAVLIGLTWVIPVSILIYERRRLEKILVPLFQVLASLPATLLMPLIVALVLEAKLSLETGAVIMVLLGTQWYLFFFISGAMRGIPREEEELCRLLKIRGLKKFRHLYFPRIFPSLIMGCLVAVGGGWNTLVIAERVVLDDFIWEVENPGIGKALSGAVMRGDVGILIAATIWMAGFIVILNRFLWRRLYQKATRLLV